VEVALEIAKKAPRVVMCNTEILREEV
jgi:hypothetical protein